MLGSYVPSLKPLRLGVKKNGWIEIPLLQPLWKIGLWDIVNLPFNDKNRSLYSNIDFENLKLYQKLLFIPKSYSPNSL